MNRRLCAVFVSALLLCAACGGDNPPAPDASPAANENETKGNPKISIVSPKEGAEVEILNATVKVEVSGFTLTHKMGLEAESGEGHIIYYIWNGFGEDGTTYEVPTTPGQPANTGGTGYVAVASAEKEHGWTSFIQPGRQTFAAQLVNNDNTPLEPPQVAKVIVDVSGAKPTGTPDSDEEERNGDEGGGGGPNG